MVGDAVGQQVVGEVELPGAEGGLVGGDVVVGNEDDGLHGVGGAGVVPVVRVAVGHDALVGRPFRQLVGAVADEFSGGGPAAAAAINGAVGEDRRGMHG